MFEFLIFSVMSLLIIVTTQADVVFDAPTLIKKDVPYKLTLSTNSNLKFPTDNFVFSFELLKSLSPRSILSQAEVTSVTYSGEEYHGFSIERFKVNEDSISMFIKFRREAHSTHFRIRYASAKTDDEKENFYGTSTNSGIILDRNIEMLLPYVITIKMEPEIGEVPTEDRMEIGSSLLSGKNGQLSCQASEGLPSPKPVFENINQLTDVFITNLNDDVTKLVWMVRLEDHNKVILCRAGRDVQNVTIKVYHYMTDVSISPSSDERVLPGSTVKCISRDGYPPPTTNWVFVYGPPEPSKYYELLDTILLINPRVLINSNWTFECHGSMFMPQVLEKYLIKPTVNYPIIKTYNFTIMGPDVLNEPIVQSSSSNTAVIVVLMILMIIVIAAAVFGVMNKTKIQQFIHDKRPGYFNGPVQLSKTPVKQTDMGYTYTVVERTDSQQNGSGGKEPTSYPTGSVHSRPVGSGGSDPLV